uniref:Ycf80 n=1 Tax=Caloglossa intermedia TaxID=100879 RepID=A0A1Z1M5Y4_9FLOR|nr:hypothetical protein [Caloglossa intermedia]ARW61416.1 hypothetical protein [Caloglossa intermedia]
MILFHSIWENYCRYFNDLSSELFKSNYSCQTRIFKSINLKKNKSILISKWNTYKRLSSKYQLKNNLGYQFISRNFWDKFINRYWQETLFVSVNNIYSDYYINQLKSSGLLIHKGNQQKKFLLNFGRDLIKGKIQVSLYKSKMNLSAVNKNSDQYIKYIWRKGVNWYIYNLYSRHLYAKNCLLKKKNIFTAHNLEAKTLPLFVVTNKNNQIVIAESPGQVSVNNFLPIFFKNFYNTFVSKKHNVGLLFINPKDALEYKSYSASKYLSLDNNPLKLFVGQLSLYYKLLYSSAYSAEFRLIPDLKEVSNLIYKYQYYNNIRFDQFQKHGKDYFQGQPVYIIKPVFVKNLYTKRKSRLNYFYTLNYDNNSARCQAIFLNYKTALHAWNKFRQDHPYYKISAQPNICVSNLEYFIKSQTLQNKIVDYILVPSPETYNFIYSKKI